MNPTVRTEYLTFHHVKAACEQASNALWETTIPAFSPFPTNKAVLIAAGVVAKEALEHLCIAYSLQCFRLCQYSFGFTLPVGCIALSWIPQAIDFQAAYFKFNEANAKIQGASDYIYQICQRECYWRGSYWKELLSEKDLEKLKEITSPEVLKSLEKYPISPKAKKIDIENLMEKAGSIIMKKARTLISDQETKSNDKNLKKIFKEIEEHRIFFGAENFENILLEIEIRESNFYLLERLIKSSSPETKGKFLAKYLQLNSYNEKLQAFIQNLRLFELESFEQILVKNARVNGNFETFRCLAKEFSLTAFDEHLKNYAKNKVLTDFSDRSNFLERWRKYSSDEEITVDIIENITPKNVWETNKFAEKYGLSNVMNACREYYEIHKEEVNREYFFKNKKNASLRVK